MSPPVGAAGGSKGDPPLRCGSAQQRTLPFDVSDSRERCCSAQVDCSIGESQNVASFSVKKVASTPPASWLEADVCAAASWLPTVAQSALFNTPDHNSDRQGSVQHQPVMPAPYPTMHGPSDRPTMNVRCGEKWDACTGFFRSVQTPRRSGRESRYRAVSSDS